MSEAIFLALEMQQLLKHKSPDLEGLTLWDNSRMNELSYALDHKCDRENESREEGEIH